MNHTYIGNKPFHKNFPSFRIFANFETDNEIDNSSIGNETTNIYKQNPVCNVYYIVSDLNAVLKSGYYETLLGYGNVIWFDDEIMKLENEMAFNLKRLIKIIC